MQEKSIDSRKIETNIKSITAYVDACITDACLRDASDIHIDPKSTHVEIRVRVHGEMQVYDRYAKVHHEELIGRIKVLAKLRIDIHDKNQDGRCFFNFTKSKGDTESADHTDTTDSTSTNDIESVDLRVSILPTFFGENVVIRVLRPELRRNTKFTELGLSHDQSEIIHSSIHREQGIIVIAGPTGSGKTTTIYTMLSILAQSQKNIVTLEDPIEYVIPGIRQVQISESADFGFSKALRALLRQDPDVIVIGEIRDRDTAELAFQASLTGHLVITTIHAEDCAGVYARLTNLGVSKDMMHSLTLMISQRLIKTSSQKRVGIFEVIPIEGKAKVTLFQNTYPEYIRKALQKQGVMLLEDSLKNIVGAHNKLPI